MNYTITKITKEIDNRKFVGDVLKFFEGFIINCSSDLFIDISISPIEDSEVELIEVKSIDEKFSIQISFDQNSNYDAALIIVPFRSTSLLWQFNDINTVIEASNYAFKIYNDYKKAVDKLDKEIIRKFDRCTLFS